MAIKAKKATEKLPPKTGGPRITKGGKSGVYGTPDNLWSAIVNRFGPIAHDLAADPENARAKNFFTKAMDAFKFVWAEIKGRSWLNPPFTFIRPWVERCVAEAKEGADIVCLVPAAVGSRWFRKWIFKKVDVIFLEGRIVFKGEKTVYPKDCMILHFHPEMTGSIEIWDWREAMDVKYQSARRIRSRELVEERKKKMAAKATAKFLAAPAAA